MASEQDTTETGTDAPETGTDASLGPFDGRDGKMSETTHGSGEQEFLSRAVEATIRFLEDSPRFNAGRGSVFTADGRNEPVLEGLWREARSDPRHRLLLWQPEYGERPGG